MKRKDWSRYEVQSYVIESYAGAEVQEINGIERPVRQFLWADEAGEVWIGNSAAFAQHVAKRFGFTPNPFDYINVNKVLLDAGERILEQGKRSPRREHRGSYIQEPKKEKAQ